MTFCQGAKNKGPWTVSRALKKLAKRDTGAMFHHHALDSLSQPQRRAFFNLELPHVQRSTA
jgi:hypothetical protein